MESASSWHRCGFITSTAWPRLRVGRCQPSGNASLFSASGDKREWGAQFWVWTTEISHFPLFAAGATDLTDPYFDMYVQNRFRLANEPRTSAGVLQVRTS